jgi:hypothetical protein
MDAKSGSLKSASLAKALEAAVKNTNRAKTLMAKLRVSRNQRPNPSLKTI